MLYFSKNTTAYIFLLLAALFWSGNFIVGKTASLHEIPPFTLNFYRWLFAWLILSPFTLREIFEKKNSSEFVFSFLSCFLAKISREAAGVFSFFKFPDTNLLRMIDVSRYKLFVFSRTNRAPSTFPNIHNAFSRPKNHAAFVPKNHASSFS